MKKINRISLYILNIVKLRRLVNGKSAYQFSLDIKKSGNYVINIENHKTPNQYNSADYPTIAEELGCGLEDILPPPDWKVSDSHEKVNKTVDSLTDPIFVLKVLEGIKVSPHANKLNNLDELYSHLSTKKAAEKAVVKQVWEAFRS